MSVTDARMIWFNPCGRFCSKSTTSPGRTASGTYLDRAGKIADKVRSCGWSMDLEGNLDLTAGSATHDRIVAQKWALNVVGDGLAFPVTRILSFGPII